MNVALRVGSDITAAACVAPFAGEVFWADGVRAYIRCDGADRPLRPSADSRCVRPLDAW